MLAATMALALATAACEHRKEPPTEPRNQLADSADQVMYNLRTVLTDRGLMRAELRADSGYFFDENTRIELRNLETVFFTQTGQRNAVLTAREGTYNTRKSNTEARKNVVVVGEDGKRLTTEQLRYDQVKNEISSDSAFVLTEPGRRVSGVGFVSDPGMRRLQVKKAITGSGTFTLPGQ